MRECATADLLPSDEVAGGIGIGSLAAESIGVASAGISEVADVVVVAELDVVRAMTLDELEVDVDVDVELLAWGMALPRLVVFH